MRYMQWIAVAASAVALSGCFEGPLDFRNAEISNGMLYGRGENKPFSGQVTNIPSSKMPVNELAAFVEVFSRLNGDEVAKAYSRVNGGGSSVFGTAFAGTYYPVSMLCDAHVSKGRLDGKAECRGANGANKFMEIPYKEGSLDGDVTFFNPNKADEAVADAPYRHGLLEGKSTVRSLKTGKVVHRVNWVAGKANGVEESFDGTTGNLLAKVDIVNGGYDGEFLKYAGDGKTLILRGHYSKGLADGVFEEYAPQTGTLTNRTIFSHGVKQADGAAPTSASEAIRETISGNTTSGDASLRTCVDGWIAKYRKEVGNEAMISADQMGEWESWCKAGKHPG